MTSQEFTFDENTVSDLHKDARGSRPGEYFWNAWDVATDSRKQEIWDMLLVELDRSIQEEK